MTNPESTPFKSAFISLIGRPNSGKSTLINAVLGSELSIATSMPQTTRKTVRGIYTGEHLQLVFVDTPGIHYGRHMYNRTISRESEYSIREKGIDLLCYVVDMARDYGKEEDHIAEMVTASGLSSCIVFNKKDQVADADARRSAFFTRYPDLKDVDTVTLAATDTEAGRYFLDYLRTIAPEGPQYFPAEQISDDNLRFFAAEFIRKAIIAHTQQEVPHACFVEIESYKEADDTHQISARIHVETQGQKGILIGKKGAGIKSIKAQARRDIANMVDTPVALSCHITVTKNWRNNKNFLRNAGYSF